MCDAQILTGLAIITSGFLSLKCATSHLSAYHWQMIAYLAWFACVTQLSGLTVIRFYLQDRPVQRNVRFALMTLLLVLVLAGLIPTGYFDWNSEAEFSAARPGDPAICFFPTNNRRNMFDLDFCRPYGFEFLDCAVAGPSSAQSMIFSVCLLAYGYCTRSIKLYKPCSRVIHSCVRDPLSQLYRNTLFKAAKWGDASTSSVQLGKNLFTRLLTVPALGFFLSIRVFLDLATSMLAEVYWLGLVLIWGTFRLIGARNFHEMPPGVIEDENQWTFGQLLPVLLLISPIFNTFGLFLSKTQKIPSPSVVGTMEMGSDNESSRALNKRPNDITRPLARSQISRLATMDISPQSWTDHDYYAAKWMPPCVGPIFVAFFYLPGIAAGVLFSIFGHMRPQSTPWRFWVTELGGIWFVILGIPQSTMFAIMLGMGLDWWFKKKEKPLGRQWLQFMFSAFFMIGYTVAVFWFSLWLPDSRFTTDWHKPGSDPKDSGYGSSGKYSIVFPSHIAGASLLTAMLYVVYAIWQTSERIWQRAQKRTQAL